MSPNQNSKLIPDVIYFPSCISRTINGIPHEESSGSAEEVFCKLLNRAGIKYSFPINRTELCCGTPWSSKGYTEAFWKMAERTAMSLIHASREGTVPIVMGTSPCSYTMIHYDEILEGQLLEKWQQVNIYDITEYLHDRVLPKLYIRKIKGTAVCHPTCSTMKMEEVDLLQGIASQCATNTVTPFHHGCCGFAGDRGLFYPELTKSATTRETEELSHLGDIIGYFSTSRTCETGMASATNQPYQSIVPLIKLASQLG